MYVIENKDSVVEILDFEERRKKKRERKKKNRFLIRSRTTGIFRRDRESVYKLCISTKKAWLTMRSSRLQVVHVLV